MNDLRIKSPGSGQYRVLPLPALDGGNLVYSPDRISSDETVLNLLMTPLCGSQPYGIKAMTDEIVSTLAIDGIECSELTARHMLSGYTPAGTDDGRAFALKCGLDFISGQPNELNGQNLQSLYQIAIDDDSCGPTRLRAVPGHRHDGLYISGLAQGAAGDSPHRLSYYIDALTEFAEGADDLDDLTRSTIVHFYITYIRPYPSGNGRLARLAHLWYLVSKGYSSALYLSFSAHLLTEHSTYFALLSAAESHPFSDGSIDITPFLLFFNQQIYNKMDIPLPAVASHARFIRALEEGKITDKDRELWFHILSAYGKSTFSAGQLARDYGNVSYTTAARFAQKFTGLGLLLSHRQNDRISYHI